MTFWRRLLLILLLVVSVSVVGCGKRSSSGPAPLERGAASAFDVRLAYAARKDNGVPTARALARVAQSSGLERYRVTQQGDEVDVDVERATAEGFKLSVRDAARLDFAMVDDDANPLKAVPDADLPSGIAVYAETIPAGFDAAGNKRSASVSFLRVGDPRGGGALAEYAKKLLVPAGEHIVLQALTQFDPDTSRSTDSGWRTLLVKDGAVLGGENVDEASVQPPKDIGRDGYGVLVKFDAAGAAALASASAANVNRRMAIVLDGVVETAPVIRAPIPGGYATITMGAGDPEKQLHEARQLETRLTRGALSSELKLIREESLGK
jgi:preprotein translocase subunit SecD